MISYFPSAGGLNSLVKKGDVFCIGTGGLNSYSSYYSNEHVLSVDTTNFLKYCTYAFLPECTYMAPLAFSNNKILKEISIPKCASIQYSTFTSCINLKKVNAPLCSSIGGSAFYGCINLQSINFPECTNISNQAFYNCKNLQKINFPKCISIGNSAFYLSTSDVSFYREINLPECQFLGPSAFQNQSISYLNLPKITFIPSHIFSNCNFSLSSSILEFSLCSYISTGAFNSTSFTYTSTLSFPECTTLDNTAFMNMTGIKNIIMPKLTSVPFRGFYGAQITSINLPLCTTLSSGAFANCTSLSTISLPLCSIIATNINGGSFAAFYNCTNLTTISLPKLSSISSYAYIFVGCTQLMSVYLMNSTMCKLSLSADASNMFQNTPILNSTYTGTFGSIYVPASLLSTYQKNTNWKTLSSRFVGI